jgi:hypothetical protein
MLEQIHATAEDQRKTQTIVALGLVAFATYALGDAAVNGLGALTAAGMLAATGGAAMLNWLRTRTTFATKRFAC